MLLIFHSQIKTVSLSLLPILSMTRQYIFDYDNKFGKAFFKILHKNHLSTNHFKELRISVLNEFNSPESMLMLFDEELIQGLVNSYTNRLDRGKEGQKAKLKMSITRATNGVTRPISNQRKCLDATDLTANGLLGFSLTTRPKSFIYKLQIPSKKTFSSSFVAIKRLQ